MGTARGAAADAQLSFPSRESSPCPLHSNTIPSAVPKIFQIYFLNVPYLLLVYHFLSR
jgi:hypothetical protein